MPRRSSRPGREPATRDWLGASATGGERLARIFQIGRPDGDRAQEFEEEVTRLRARLRGLEEELQGLRLAANEVLYSPPVSLPATIDLPRLPPAGDLDYWLCRCERFRVYADGRKLGVVEGARFESRADRPDLLEVRAPFGRRSLLIPVDEVEAVRPDERAVIVDRIRRTPGARERLHARLAQLQAFLH